MNRPSFEQVLAYASSAVRSEYENPYHGRSAHYDNQSVMNDVLNHFDGLSANDEDEQLIREAVQQAEQQFGEQTDIWL